MSDFNRRAGWRLLGLIVYVLVLTAANAATPAGCSGDKCFSAISKGNTGICKQIQHTTPSALPYKSACSGSLSSISKACSCIAAASPTPTTSKTSKTTTTKKSTTTPTSPSTAPTDSIPIYTFKSINNTAGCPYMLPTASLNTLTVTDPASSGIPAYTAYAGPTGSILPQVMVANASNTTQKAIYNFKNTSRIEIFYQFGGKQRVVIDDHGARIYTGDCSQQIFLPINNFASVINQYGPPAGSKVRRRLPQQPSSAENSLQKRANNTYLGWEVYYIDQCGNPISADHNASASCDITNVFTGFDTGQRPVSLRNDGNGNFHGICVVPDMQSAEQECEDTVKSILDWPTQGLVGQLTNVGGDLLIAGTIISRGSVARLIAGAAALFDLPAVAIGIGILSVYQGFIALHGDDFIARNYCPYLLNFQLETEGKLDVERSSAVLNYQMTQPFTSWYTTRTVSLSTCTTSTSTAPSCSVTPPAAPYASCDSPVSGCDNGYYSCGPDSADCLCGRNINGDAMCFPYGFCIAPTCASDADCCGGACLEGNTCCKRPICVDVTRCVNAPQKVKEYFAAGDPDAVPIVSRIKQKPVKGNS